MSFKFFVLLAGLLGGVQPGAAQGRDTVFAVHKLFAQKRQHGERAAAGGASLATDAATLPGAIEGTMVGAAPTLLGLRTAERYSIRREQEILSRYATGVPLPAEVRRQLRRKHFHRTAKDVAGQRP